ncbi:CobW family GTP-binding protein [Aquabacter cavernae]|uniref:CobW family GTP-binding protein n=1 Tax=Aquabacter cavernae TaxID=2496029 RepID=UPI000F8E43C6|nr:GTP-binding protein [Aquabacter cavernae]
MADAHAVPVLLVSGSLGAGKTSLINLLLGADHGLALAVIVNDFGAINIDEAILAATGQPIYGLKNGCICCSLQGDLLRTLASLLSLGRPLDAIVIEASGVSDPRGIMEALFDPVLRAAVRLDAVVTVVDAQEHDPADDLWCAQVRAADLVVLSKTGQTAPASVAALRARLGEMGKTLVFSADEAGGIPLDLLFARTFDHARPSGADPHPLITDARFTWLEWTASGPVSLPRFQAAIGSLAPHLARAKGFLAFRERPGQGFLFQLVGRRASLTPSDGPDQGTRLVLIGPTGRFDPRRAEAALDTTTRE